MSWYKDGSVVTCPLQGLVRFLVHLAEQLHRASIGQLDLERKSTRLVSVHRMYVVLSRKPRKYVVYKITGIHYWSML